jgi:hypothetical protein
LKKVEYGEYNAATTLSEAASLLEDLKAEAELRSKTTGDAFAPILLVIDESFPLFGANPGESNTNAILREEIALNLASIVEYGFRTSIHVAFASQRINREDWISQAQNIVPNMDARIIFGQVDPSLSEIVLGSPAAAMPAEPRWRGLQYEAGKSVIEFISDTIESTSDITGYSSM